MSLCIFVIIGQEKCILTSQVSPRRKEQLLAIVSAFSSANARRTNRTFLAICGPRDPAVLFVCTCLEKGWIFRAMNLT